MSGATSHLRSDFTRVAWVDTEALAWTPSPIGGVDRKMLDRLGEEVARATSLVRYAPASRFSPHVHTGGEEFLVLDGVFEDEHGAYPAGSYLRNPPGSSHRPSSGPGCVIFVKLWQFEPDDLQPVCLLPDDVALRWRSEAGGREIAPLHLGDHEQVALERWAPGSAFEQELAAGGELLLLAGAMTVEIDGAQVEIGPHTWLRLPPGATLRGQAALGGATLWRKSGHLLRIRQPLTT
jgi:quercetin dioxygenase-like cupin family protein